MNLRKLYGDIYKPFFQRFRSERLRRLIDVCGVSENS
ncbi:MAG: hypothetical protein JWM54_546, partial [Acidobacteriaceae bacterium]|nr:hypothetical protein [Acidobacteriaceae bacterium]